MCTLSPFLLFNLLFIVVLFSSRALFVTRSTPFYFENVSETFVYEGLDLSGRCLGYTPCLIISLSVAIYGACLCCV